MTKILLVEDDKSLREIYGVRLLAEGYDIVSAGDGEEALAVAIKDRPDLILSDVMMPKISGFDMLDILRSTTETRNIKVIMMTALSSDDQRQRGVSLGADRYLVKSQVGIEDVVRIVHEVLSDASLAAVNTNPLGPINPATPQASAPITSAPPISSVPQPQPVPTPRPQDPIPVPAGGGARPYTPTSAPMPQAPVQPIPAVPAPPLPQPTAPFSTPRPGTLGDRVIQPLGQSQPERDFANMMSQELSTHTASDNAFAVPTQAPQPPIANTAATTTQNSTPPQLNSPMPPVPPLPPAPSSGLDFEETTFPAPRPPM